MAALSYDPGVGVATSFDRSEALRRLGDETFDVLVIGGGATGAGVALDAASRGLRTALVERTDFGAGTSSYSSKMIHGGLRYLQQGDFSLVYQSLTERKRLLENAPHLVQVMGFLVPIYTEGGLIPKIVARLFGLVLWGYDIVGGWSWFWGRRHQRLGRDDTLAHMPTLDAEFVDSGYLYFDAQADDARLTLSIARTAALDHSAVVANHAAVTGLLTNAEGRLEGAVVDTGQATLEVRATAVVNAAGVWVDGVGVLDGMEDPTIRPARGVHVVVPRRAVENDVAVILAVPDTPSTIFVVPWGEVAYVGTTDTDYEGDLDSPYCTADDVRYLLASLNHSTDHEVTADDVVGSWAGLRPLLRDAADDRTADLSRRHSVIRSESGLITVAGGKLTTWRLMAEDTVDEVLRLLERDAECRTRSVRLRGADGYDQVSDGGLGQARRDHLVGRYGSDAATVIAIVNDDPSLGEPLVAGLPYLKAEAVYAARHEMAVTLDDVLSRRTMARLLARDASSDAAEAVAGIIAGALGWSPDDCSAQVDDYRASVAVERTAMTSSGPDPSTATDKPLGWAPTVRLSSRLTR
ncbi:glycerol-3-phosphate dehydrogenase [soil metagenome]